MNLEALRDKVREMKAADASQVRLVVFHSFEDRDKAVAQIPEGTSNRDFPGMVVCPELVAHGTALCVGDREIARSIVKYVDGKYKGGLLQDQGGGLG